MKQIVIDSDSHPLYATFKDLYRVSFPIFEQRSESQQAQAFKNHKYKLLAFTEEHTFLGFIAYWQFDSYRYVEHFAINADLRGKGYGSRVLNEFTHSAPETVILEIDPIQDDVTEARWRFYEKCGFCKNPYTHLHPPYNKEAYSPHALVVLSSEKEITELEYQTFFQDLRTVVMD